MGGPFFWGESSQSREVKKSKSYKVENEELGFCLSTLRICDRIHSPGLPEAPQP